jgi:hypothetical protein
MAGVTQPIRRQSRNPVLVQKVQGNPPLESDKVNLNLQIKLNLRPLRITDNLLK